MVQAFQPEVKKYSFVNKGNPIKFGAILVVLKPGALSRTRPRIEHHVKMSHFTTEINVFTAR